MRTRIVLANFVLKCDMVKSLIEENKSIINIYFVINMSESNYFPILVRLSIGGMLNFRVTHNTKLNFFVFLSKKAFNFVQIAFNRN